MSKEQTEYEIFPERSGENHLTCPVCSQDRQKKAARCLSFNAQKGIGVCHHCGETLFEKTDGMITNKRIIAEPPPKELYTIPAEQVDTTLCNYHKNNFAVGLHDKFGRERTERLLQHWRIGTSTKHPGATIFWLIDKQWQIRTGHIMLYDNNLRRVKDGELKDTKWAHGNDALIPAHQQRRNCFFGEHQLYTEFKLDHLPIGIVSSEKTAVICSHFIPGIVWMASSSDAGLNEYKMQALRGRTVVLFPDLDAHDKWMRKANELRHITKIEVSNYLSDHMTEDEKLLNPKADMADLLLNQLNTTNNAA